MPQIRAKMPDGSIQTFASEEEARAAADRMRATPVDTHTEAPARSKVLDTVQAVLGMTNPFMAQGLGVARRELTDPENLSTLGGAVGGIGAGLLTKNPAAAVTGATLGGTLASHYGEGKDWGAAMKEGSAEGMFEGAGPLLGALKGPTAKAGKALVEHSFGPQKQVVSEFGERLTGDAIEALTDLKLQRTGILEPVGGRTLPRALQRMIDDAVQGRQAVLDGPAGQRPVDPRAAWSAVETPEGATVTPLKDLYTRTRKQFAPGDDLKTIGAEVRKGFDNSALTTHVPVKTAPGALPKELSGLKLTPEMEAALRQQLGLDEGGTRWKRQLRPSIAAKDMQGIVSGTYKKVDDLGGYATDPGLKPKRDALKAMARGMKEEYTRVAPETLPFNREMEQLIPLREAAVVAEAGQQADPLIRLGETFALAGRRPGLATGSLLNRPKVESMLGQSLYTMGTKSHRGPRITSNALRALVALLQDRQ